VDDTPAYDEHLPIPRPFEAVARLLRTDWRSGGLTIVVLFGAMKVLGLLGDVGVVLGGALAAGYGLTVLSSAAHGHPRLPEPTEFEGLESWLVPLGQFVLALAPAVVLVGADYLATGPRFVLVTQAFEPPFVWTPRRWLLLGAGLAFSPPGLITTAVAGHPLAALHIPMNLRFAVRAGRDLVPMVLLLWLLAGLLFAVQAGRGVTGAWGLELFGLAAMSVGAFAMGWMVYRRADDFGIARRPEHVRRRGPFEMLPGEGPSGPSEL